MWIKNIQEILSKYYSKPLIFFFWLIALITNLFWLHSYYTSSVGYKPVQPVAFSHKTHSGKFGIKCLYCHTNSENSPLAGIPATKTCMICHIGLDTKPELLKTTIETYEKNQYLKWNKIYRIPDYTHFNHSRHIRACIDCSSCHGEVENEDVLYRIRKLNMLWCLDCHREPEKYIIFAKSISGIFTYNIDSSMYVSNLNLKYITEPGYGSYFTNNTEQIIKGIPMPKYAGFGAENCSACHY